MSIRKINDKSGIILLLVLYILLITVTGIGCPIKWLTGISCPGCGITRSCISLLKFDFKQAFEYHALTLVLVPSIIYILFGKQPLFGTKKRQRSFLTIIIVVVLLYYTIRLIYVRNDVISIDISNSFMLKLVKIVKGLFS